MSVATASATLSGSSIEGPGALAPPKLPEALLLLGQVDELEMQREGVREPLPVLDVEIVEPFGNAPCRCQVGALAEGHEIAARLLHEGQELRATLLGDDLAEQCPEEPDLAGQRIARPGAADAAGLTADRRIGAPAGRPGHAPPIVGGRGP